MPHYSDEPGYEFADRRREENSMHKKHPLSIIFLSALVVFTGIGIYGDGANSSEIMQLFSPHAGRLKLKSAELQLLSKGEIIARDAPASHPKEMAGFGAMLVEAEPKDFAEAFRTLSVFKQGKSTIACGRFGSQPTLIDLAGLTVNNKDLLGLMRARVNASDVKLSEADITRIQTIAGSNPQLSNKLIAKLTDEYKSILLEKVKSYAALGGRSIGAYADQSEPVDSNDALIRMLRYQSSYAGYREQFHTLVGDPAHVNDEKVESFHHWAVQKFGRLKPIISLIHVTIFQEDTRVFIVSKQIYSSHYTEAGLGIAELIPLTSQQGKNCTLVAYTIRLQVDIFGGAMGFLKNRMARPHMLEMLKESLQGLRTNVEASSRASVHLREGS